MQQLNSVRNGEKRFFRSRANVFCKITFIKTVNEYTFDRQSDEKNEADERLEVDKPAETTEECD